MGMGDIAEAREAVRELQAIQSGKNPYETTITGKIKHDAPKDDICPECNEMVAMPEDDYICCKCRKKRK